MVQPAASALATSRAPLKLPATGQLDDDEVQTLFIGHFKELIAPFFERLKLLRQGRVLEAVSRKPSGIWYGYSYALALHSLGQQLIPVNGKSKPASEIYGQLREAGCFYHPLVPSKYWSLVDKVSSVSGKSLSAIRMKEGVSPSAAFRSFQSQLSLLDCTHIMDIAFGLTLIDIFGAEKFDCFLKTLCPIGIGLASEDPTANRLSALFSEAASNFVPSSIDSPLNELVRGQTYYVRNLQDYNDKHPHGVSQGHNLIYFGDGKFLGFGYNPEGVTLREIAEDLCEEYNAVPIADEVMLPSLHLEAFRSYLMPIGNREFTVTRKQVQAYIEGTARHEIFTPEVARTVLLPVMDRLDAERAQLSTKRVALSEFLRRSDLVTRSESGQTKFSATRVNQLLV